MAENEFVKIMSVGGTAEAEQIVRYLRKNGIAAYHQGGIMEIYAGTTMAGQEIMISEIDRETALKLLGEFRPIKTGPYRRSVSRGQRILCGILLAMIIIIIIFSIMMAAI